MSFLAVDRAARLSVHHLICRANRPAAPPAGRIRRHGAVLSDTRCTTTLSRASAGIVRFCLRHDLLRAELWCELYDIYHTEFGISGGAPRDMSWNLCGSRKTRGLTGGAGMSLQIFCVDMHDYSHYLSYLSYLGVGHDVQILFLYFKVFISSYPCLHTGVFGCRRCLLCGWHLYRQCPCSTSERRATADLCCLWSSVYSRVRVLLLTIFVKTCMDVQFGRLIQLVQINN